MKLDELMGIVIDELYAGITVPVLLIPAGYEAKVADAAAAIPRARVCAFPGAQESPHRRSG